jgi:hypothetical protein
VEDDHFRVGVGGTNTATFSNISLHKATHNYPISNYQSRKAFLCGGNVGELYQPQIEEYHFRGWYTGENKAGTQVLPSSSYSRSITAYSAWEAYIKKIYIDTSKIKSISADTTAVKSVYADTTKVYG